MPTEPFSDLAAAAYCPRKLYYRRRDDDSLEPPPEVRAVRELAFAYGRLVVASDEMLADQPLAVSPLQFRRNLGCARARFDPYSDLDAVADDLPTTARHTFLAGKDAHGVVHKLLETDPPAPVLISSGEPPPQGVWEPQRVRAVAAAKALAYEREREIPRAFYEYPAHGCIREVRLTARNKAIYRRILRATQSLDGPPPRLGDDAKCSPCDYRNQCGVQTRSLKTMLGL